MKGVLEGAQTVYPKIEPYLLEADKVVKSKIYPKIEPYLLEVDKSYKVVKSKIYPKIEPYLLKFDEVMCKCLATKETEKTKDPTSQLAKAAPAVKTSAAKSVRSMPPQIFGGFVKTVYLMLETEAEVKLMAAVKIQALFRGICDRKRAKAKKARKAFMFFCIVEWVVLLLVDSISFVTFAGGSAAVGALFVAYKMTKKKRIKTINTDDATSQVAKEAPVVVKKNAAKVVRSAPPPAAVAGSAGKDGAAPSMDSPALPSLEKWARSIGIYGVLPKTKDGKVDTDLALKLTGILVSIWPVLIE